MSDTSIGARPTKNILTKDFTEKILIISAIPIWLGIASYLKWIGIADVSIILLIIYTGLVALLFTYIYVKRTPVVRQVGFMGITDSRHGSLFNNLRFYVVPVY